MITALAVLSGLNLIALVAVIILYATLETLQARSVQSFRTVFFTRDDYLKMRWRDPESD